MNSLFSYLYRDACNYKKYKDVVIQGQLTLEDLQPYLQEGEFFIPSEVGLEDLQNDPLTVDDHIWHAIDSITPTSDKPEVAFSAIQFIDSFRKANKIEWNQFEVFRRKGMI